VNPEVGDPGAPASARRLVTAAVVLLLIPGILGFDLWPLTGWRLFSLARAEEQTMWVIDAIGDDGSTRTVSLEELPLQYRHAAWPMAELPTASTERRDAVCQALLDAVADVVPDVAELHIVRDDQRLVERHGAWEVAHHPSVLHRCSAEGPG
jgi:hypothetical protein